MSNYKYSLVVATYGRRTELDALLASLVSQTIAAGGFEVILVDQNEGDLIAPLVEKYAASLHLKHIRSGRKGLSHNRNLGIAQASGQYIAVPDDDCEYYADSLQRAGEELERLSYPDMLIGRVFNRSENRHVFKRTPDQACPVNGSNFYALVSSISLFFKRDGSTFDEAFGIGEKYHSNEDGELILNFLSQQKRVVYTPLVEFYHPPYNAATMSVEKLYKYGIGFGALCKKYRGGALFFLFFKVLVFQALMLIKALLTLNAEQVRRRWNALAGRLKGFMIYSPEPAGR